MKDEELIRIWTTDKTEMPIWVWYLLGGDNT